MSRWLLLLVCWLGGPAWAQTDLVGAFNRGNEYYRQGQYPQARDQYLEVVAAGVQDPRVYYNLGNACFKAGRLGEAVLWYKRAQRLAPRDPEARANLRLAEALRFDQTSPPGGAGQWLEELYLFPTLDELCLVFSLFFLAACGLGGWRLWRGAWAGGWQLAALIGCAALAVAAGGYLGARVYGETRPQVVVLAAELSARSGPGPEQPAVFAVREGACLELARREGDWVLVRLPGGLGGWLPAQGVEAL